MSNREGLSDAQVLAALYNSSHAQGMGMFKARPGEMTVEEAEKLVTGTRDEPGQPSSGSYFDYLNGRIIKVNVSKDPLDFRLYDRDHGSGAGDRAIRIMLDKLTRPA